MRMIAKVPLFAGLSKRDLAKVASIADEIDFRTDKVLTREGERGREFFVLLDGEAEVRRRGKRLATRGAGDFFGEIALVSSVSRVATVTTISPARALVITDRDFRSPLRSSPPIAPKVLEAVAQRIPPDAL